MKLVSNIDFGRLILLSTLIVLCSAFGALFIFPFVWFMVWIFFDFSAANHYVAPLTIILSVFLGNLAADHSFTGASSNTSDKKNNVTKNEVDKSSTSEAAFILSIFSLVIYFSFFSDFDFSPKEDESKKSEMTLEERERIRLDIECRDIGYRYARVASESFNGKSAGADVIIPAKCRGRASTRRGMELYYQ